MAYQGGVRALPGAGGPPTCDLSVAGGSDRLADTLDYGAITDRVIAVVGGSDDQLLERLATRIAEAVCVDDRVAWVTVALRKLRPPVPHELSTSGVRIGRRGPAHDGAG